MKIEERILHRVDAAIPRQREPIFDSRYDDSVTTRQYSAIEFNQILELRELAGDGVLAATAATALPAHRHALSGAAFAVAWPVVFTRITRGLERARGHAACASSVFRMAQECLDHFYDDVEATVHDVLAHANTPIANLEAWIASRLVAATVNGHRRRRGERGALQRPRLPHWLTTALDGDSWLCELAIQVLLWVGVATTAGSQLYPLDTWALRRITVTGDLTACDAAAVSRDLETVLAAMRSRPTWYANYIERPLGRKQAPVAAADSAAEVSPLLLTNPDDQEDARLARMAADALHAIEQRLDESGDPAEAVTEALRSVFLADRATGDLDRLPHAAVDYDRRVALVLGDPAQIDAVVAVVLHILDRPVRQ